MSSLQMNPDEVLSPLLRKLYKSTKNVAKGKKNRHHNRFTVYDLREKFIEKCYPDEQANKKIFRSPISCFKEVLRNFIKEYKNDGDKFRECINVLMKNLEFSNDREDSNELELSGEKLKTIISKTIKISIKKSKIFPHTSRKDLIKNIDNTIEKIIKDDKKKYSFKLEELVEEISIRYESSKETSSKRVSSEKSIIKKYNLTFEFIFGFDREKKDPKEKSILIEFRNISVRLPNYDIINIMEKKLLDELFNKKLNRELSKFVFKFIHALLYFLYQNLENPTKLINALQIESDKDIKNYLRILLFHFHSIDGLIWACFKHEVCKSCIAAKEYTLSTGREKIIRDPMYGDMIFEPDEIVLIDTCYMQRLRRIRQMGFLDFIFPDAVNTRFDHSLGVAHIAKRIYSLLKKRGLFKKIFSDIVANSELCKNLKEKEKERIINLVTKLEEKVVTYAAILHDIGHVPFSHTGEGYYNILIEGNNNSRNNLKKLQLNELRHKILKEKPHEGNGFFLIVERKKTLTTPAGLNAIPITKNSKLRKEAIFKNCLYITLKKLFEYYLTQQIKKLNLNIKIKENAKETILDLLIARVALYIINLNKDKLFENAKEYLKEIKYPIESKNDKLCMENEMFMRCLYIINKELTENADHYPFHEIINGEWIDADKLDYYFRNAYFSGHEFIIGHRDRIINSISICKNANGKYFLSVYGKSIDTAYSLIFNRYFLDKAIHSHPLNLGMEHIMKRLLREYKESLIKKKIVDLSKVYEEWKRLLRNNDIEFISLLLNEFIKNRLFDKAAELFKLMHRSKLKTFTIIELFTLNNNKKLKKVLNDLEEKIKKNDKKHLFIYIREERSPTESLNAFSKIRSFMRTKGISDLTCEDEESYLKTIHNPGEKETILARLFIYIDMSHLFDIMKSTNESIYNILDKQRKCINEIVDKLNKNKEDYEIKIRTIRPLLGNRSNFLSMQKRCHENRSEKR
ncbi:MAG: HD domain-containing protein [Candidatus Asgardarchaeum sp.]